MQKFILGVINIFGKIFLRGISLELARLNKALKAEFMRIRQESEEHLQAINENTNEITSNYECLCELECKLDRLSERVEHIEMHLELHPDVCSKKSKFDVKRLNRKEQDVFLVIYTLEEEKGSIPINPDRYDDPEHLRLFCRRCKDRKPVREKVPQSREQCTNDA